MINLIPLKIGIISASITLGGFVAVPAVYNRVDASLNPVIETYNPAGIGNLGSGRDLFVCAQRPYGFGAHTRILYCESEDGIRKVIKRSGNFLPAKKAVEIVSFDGEKVDDVHFYDTELEGLGLYYTKTSHKRRSLDGMVALGIIIISDDGLRIQRYDEWLKPYQDIFDREKDRSEDGIHERKTFWRGTEASFTNKHLTSMKAKARKS